MQPDHDLLVVLVESVRQLTAKFDKIAEDHESRIRRCEKLIYTALGAMSALELVMHLFLKK